MLSQETERVIIITVAKAKHLKTFNQISWKCKCKNDDNESTSNILQPSWN